MTNPFLVDALLCHSLRSSSDNATLHHAVKTDRPTLSFVSSSIHRCRLFIHPLPSSIINFDGCFLPDNGQLAVLSPSCFAWTHISMAITTHLAKSKYRHTLLSRHGFLVDCWRPFCVFVLLWSIVCRCCRWLNHDSFVTRDLTRDFDTHPSSCILYSTSHPLVPRRADLSALYTRTMTLPAVNTRVITIPHQDHSYYY